MKASVTDAVADAVPNRSRAGMRTVDQAARDNRAASLRASGMTWNAVAAELGVTGPTALRMARRCIRDAALVPAEDMLSVEDAKLDFLEAKLTEAILHPGPIVSAGRELPGSIDMDRRTRAADALRRVHESRRKLHGWDAPARRHVTMSTEARTALAVSLIGRIRESYADGPVIQGEVEPAPPYWEALVSGDDAPTAG